MTARGSALTFTSALRRLQAGQLVAPANPWDREPLRADPMRLKLLLRNLIDNALRHSAGASRPPVVALRREPDGRTAIAVRDFGPGVSDEQLQRLSEPFYRTDSARARATGGVGLGLYLCRLVAQAHGGELRLRRAEPGLEATALLATH